MISYPYFFLLVNAIIASLDLENRKPLPCLEDGCLQIVIPNYDLEIMISDYGYLKSPRAKQALGKTAFFVWWLAVECIIFSTRFSTPKVPFHIRYDISCSLRTF